MRRVRTVSSSGLRHASVSEVNVFARELERVEDHQYGRVLSNDFVDALVGGAEALLKAAEFGPTALVANDDLAVEQRAQREHLSCLQELGEPRSQVAAISTEQPSLARCAAPQQAAKAIQLGFVAPLRANR